MLERDMDFFEVVQKRRSIRRYQTKPFPVEGVQKALEAAILAPNSSNTQTWNFHWIQSDDKKKKVAELCLNQSAARSASHLIVVTADPKLWRRSQDRLIQWVQQAKAPQAVLMYYEKLIPWMYKWGFFNFIGAIKFLIYNAIGIFKPIMRGPTTRRDAQEVAIKSAALAAENFVLAIVAQGGATCMMEGFDECRMKKLLHLSSSCRVVMVISVGYEGERATWGPQFRLPLEEVLKIH